MTSGVRIGSRCLACGGSVRWEGIRDRKGERWLGICGDCGRFRLVFPAHADDAADPLLTFLTGETERRPPGGRPPWIRFVALTSGFPWNVPWSLGARRCDECAAQIAATRTVYWEPHTLSSYSICLACGQTTVYHEDA